MRTLVATGGGEPGRREREGKSSSISLGGSSVGVGNLRGRDRRLCTSCCPAGSAAGVSVKTLAGEAVCANGCGAPDGHSSANALAVALTLSLKLMTMAESTGRWSPHSRAWWRQRWVRCRPANRPPSPKNRQPPGRGRWRCHRDPATGTKSPVHWRRSRQAWLDRDAVRPAHCRRAPRLLRRDGPVKLSAGTVVQPVAGALAPVIDARGQRPDIER